MKKCETKYVDIFQNGKNSNLLQLSDAQLRTDDSCTFNAHRMTLARSSDYFRAMFCGMDTDRREFRIPGISGECLSDILGYFYTGYVQVTENNARDLMIAADYLLLKDLRMQIKRNIKAHLTEVNCLRILQAAHQISDEDIFLESIRFITTRFEGVMPCQKNDLANLPLEVLILILSNRSLYVYSETTVWQAIVEWTQKNIPLRMRHIPQLLMTLAMEDVGEKLATEILQHEIVLQNPLFRRIRSRRDLQSDQNSKRKKISDLDVLLSFLRSYSTRIMEPNRHRIPLKLHVLCFRTGAGDRHNIYITYDENPDFLRKITEVSCDSSDSRETLVAVSHNIYIYSYLYERLLKFNLRTMKWGSMESFSGLYEYPFFVATGRYVYVLGEMLSEVGRGTHRVEVYDTVDDRWFNGVPLRNFTIGTAVAIEEKIYAVGLNRYYETTMKMFDPAVKQWFLLSPPALYYDTFRLVAYHQKIYMVGSYPEHDLGPELSNMAVFDPAKNVWEKLPDVPYDMAYTTPDAVVFDDQLIFFDRSYGNKRNRKIARWNDAKKCWEELEETCIFKDLHLLQSSCIIEDVDTIRIITKQNRDPKTKMEKSLFN